MPAPSGQSEPTDVRLGRFPQFDSRSRDYTIRTLLEADKVNKPRSYTWARGTQLNQGAIGACVGFGWINEVSSKPKPRAVLDQNALDVYHYAQTIDEWPGENYEGTSIIAGIKAAIHFGLYSDPSDGKATYRWAGAGSGRMLEDTCLAIGYYGPAVIGISWHHDMFTPDAKGFIHPTGTVDGGHAIEVRGVTCRWPKGLIVLDRRFDNLDMNASYFRLNNSWGGNWGVSGECFVSFAEMQTLLLDGGECCIPIRRL